MASSVEEEDEVPSFVKARAFVGKRAGFVFKTGDQGLGYYLDDARSAKRRRLEEGEDSIPDKPLPAELRNGDVLATTPAELPNKKHDPKKKKPAFNPYADLPPPKKKQQQSSSSSTRQQQQQTQQPSPEAPNVKVFAPGLFKVSQVRVLHILRKHSASRRPTSWRAPNVKISRTAEEATRDLEALRRKLQKAPRAIFEEAARQTSDCNSAHKGGDLGWFGLGKMTPAFERVAFNLELNELSSVVATPSGVHLLLRIG